MVWAAGVGNPCRSPKDNPGPVKERLEDVMASKAHKRKYCIRCRDNFYNGNNEYGIQECWCLDDAKVVWKKFVSMDMRPP